MAPSGSGGDRREKLVQVARALQPTVTMQRARFATPNDLRARTKLRQRSGHRFGAVERDLRGPHAIGAFATELCGKDA